MPYSDITCKSVHTDGNAICYGYSTSHLVGEKGNLNSYGFSENACLSSESEYSWQWNTTNKVKMVWVSRKNRGEDTTWENTHLHSRGLQSRHRHWITDDTLRVGLGRTTQNPNWMHAAEDKPTRGRLGTLVVRLKGNLSDTLCPSRVLWEKMVNGWKIKIKGELV